MDRLERIGNMSVSQTHVVVAMSGGVDSSVSAAILVNQGYRVTGMMLRLWSEPTAEGLNRCCSPESMAQARRVSAKLGIPFYAIDVQERFRGEVVQYFIDGYTEGVTPNPCMVCNRNIRWGYLLKHAKGVGADYLATGHYARLEVTESGQYQLLKGVDPSKDQSYVLSMLDQDRLSKTLFPLGNYHKTDVRQLARDFSLSVADKADSQDLCFISDGDYRRFLQKHSVDTPQPGPIVNTQGMVLGEHKGLPYYTTGQRKGLGISNPDPYFVINKDVNRNALIVGLKEELGRNHLIAHDANWISGIDPEIPFRAQLKIRYKSTLAWGRVTPLQGKRFEVLFEEPLRDITPGQIVVVYHDDVCLGGGIISQY